MNKVVLGYLQEKGYKVVAVFGHHDVGSDAGEIAGLGNAGVNITHPDHAREVLKETAPIVAILATRSFLKDLEKPLRVMAESKVNVITIGEEAFYSWNTEPKLTQELDVLFRSNGVSLSGTGYQDAYWLYLAAMLVGVSLKVDRLVCHTSYNVDDYGAALCEAHGVGLTKEEFKAKFSDSASPAYVWASNEALAVRLGWKILKTVQEYQPLTAGKVIPSKSYGPHTLAADQVNGLKAVVITTAETRCGRVVEIETHQIG